MATTRTRIGISGWRYEPWRGTFYPKDLPQRAELEYASAHLPVIEINGSFYSLQLPESYASWYEDTPDDFMFSVKGPRFITHMKRLKEVEAPLANFLASGVFNLKEKLGPILWQFPPNFAFEPERFEAFLKLLPHDTEEAATIARGHDDRMKGRAQLNIDAKRPMRHAVEIRHESFLDPAFVDMLRKYNVALVIAETARKWPMTQDITADFVYMRLHGDKELYKSGYSDKSLDRWARRISAWQKGSEPADAEKISSKKPPTKSPRDVFCFFDNTDVKLRAPFDAQTLMEKLGIPKRDVPMDIGKRLSAKAKQGEGEISAEADRPARHRKPDAKASRAESGPRARRASRTNRGPSETGRRGAAGSQAGARRAKVGDAGSGRGIANARRAGPRAAGGPPGRRGATGARTSGRIVRRRKSGASVSRRRGVAGSRQSVGRSS